MYYYIAERKTFCKVNRSNLEYSNKRNVNLTDPKGIFAKKTEKYFNLRVVTLQFLLLEGIKDGNEDKINSISHAH